jgi:hypothetical protein
MTRTVVAVSREGEILDGSATHTESRCQEHRLMRIRRPAPTQTFYGGGGGGKSCGRGA